MGKQLILFRHAKSDWDAGIDDDHERPLNKRGRKAARAMGKALTRSAQIPDAVLTSSAVRARATLELAAAAGEWPCEQRVSSELYENSSARVLELIQREDDAIERLLLVGHEPTWCELTTRLIGGGSIRFPTAAMVRIDFPVEQWRHVVAGRGELIWLVPPKFFTHGSFSDL
jgi:phosphohistidine phosphatase